MRKPLTVSRSLENILSIELNEEELNVSKESLSYYYTNVFDNKELSGEQKTALTKWIAQYMSQLTKILEERAIAGADPMSLSPVLLTSTDAEGLKTAYGHHYASRDPIQMRPYSWRWRAIDRMLHTLAELELVFLVAAADSEGEE